MLFLTNSFKMHCFEYRSKYLIIRLKSILDKVEENYYMGKIQVEGPNLLGILRIKVRQILLIVI